MLEQKVLDARLLRSLLVPTLALVRVFTRVNRYRERSSFQNDATFSPKRDESRSEDIVSFIGWNFVCRLAEIPPESVVPFPFRAFPVYPVLVVLEYRKECLGTDIREIDSTSKRG